MQYVKGSHKWREFAPNVLITNEPISKRHKVPPVPNIEKGAKDGQYEVITFDGVVPGDVIIHHPNCIHGSGANVSGTQRRLAASVRYVGSGIRWMHKDTNANGLSLTKKWEIPRVLELTAVAAITARRLGRLIGLVGEKSFYHDAQIWAPYEMKNGELFGDRDAGRVAFPVVWTPTLENTKGLGVARL
jgi:hypothetical protein